MQIGFQQFFMDQYAQKIGLSHDTQSVSSIIDKEQQLNQQLAKLKVPLD